MLHSSYLVERIQKTLFILVLSSTLKSNETKYTSFEIAKFSLSDPKFSVFFFFNMYKILLLTCMPWLVLTSVTICGWFPCFCKITCLPPCPVNNNDYLINSFVVFEKKFDLGFLLAQMDVQGFWSLPKLLIKGVLISESVSLLLKSPKNVPKTILSTIHTQKRCSG